MKIFSFLVVVCSLFLTVSCSSISDDCTSCGSEKSSNKSSDHLRGRDIVKQGKSVAMSGVLQADGNEWQLKSTSGVYNVHFGPERYRDEKGITLKDGKKISLTGFIVKKDIAVFTLELNGKKYTFRNKEGRPAWAGRGQGRNRK